MKKGQKKPIYTAAMSRRARELYEDGLTLEKTAAKIQEEFNLAKAPSRSWVDNQVDTRSPQQAHRRRVLGRHHEDVARQARLMARGGHSCKEIRDELGITQDRLRSILGKSMPARGASISRYHDRVKPWRVQQRREAAMLRELGWSYGKIGRKFGVSSTAASDWVQREKREAEQGDSSDRVVMT